MSRQVSPSTDKIYGLQRVARLWGVSPGDPLSPPLPSQSG